MMAKFKIETNLNDFKKQFIQATEEQIKQGVEKGLKVCASEIKQMEQRQIENTTGDGDYTPTGQLKRSVTIMPIQWNPYGASITVVPTASYSVFVELGTGIYVPGGRKDGWVYPIGDDQFRFTYGIPPHYFVQDAYEFYKDKAPVIIEEQIYKCLR